MRKLVMLLGVFILLFLIACLPSPNANSSSEPEVEHLAMTGKKVYSDYCVACHGADGKMSFSGATDLSKSTLDLETRVLQITHGKGLMNAFKGIISEEEIKNVALYIEALRE